MQQSIKKPGRPRRWRSDEGIYLYANVLHYTQRGFSIRSACTILSKTHSSYADYSASQLNSRFHEIKRDYSLVRFMDNVRKYGPKEQAEGWIIEYFSTVK